MTELVKRFLIHRFDSLEKVVVCFLIQTTDSFSSVIGTDIRVAMWFLYAGIEGASVDRARRG
jgi:hypothetical protein